MRLAILADIHGNLPAFEAALAHVARQRVDRIILAGDVAAGAPDSAACWKLARSLGCPMLRGNHERYIAHFGTPQAHPLWATEQFSPLHWAVRQFTDAERHAMMDLPLTLRLPEVPGVMFCHASARDDHDTVAAYTPDALLAEMFAGCPEPTIVRGHNHTPRVRIWGERDERVIITAGSVGLALDANPTLQYLLLEQASDTARGWRARHHSVPYDMDAAVRRFHDSGYLQATGAMGRLYLRELVTATPQIVPFLRAYERWKRNGAIGLAEAGERFLREV